MNTLVRLYLNSTVEKAGYVNKLREKSKNFIVSSTALLIFIICSYGGNNGNTEEWSKSGGKK